MAQSAHGAAEANPQVELKTLPDVALKEPTCSIKEVRFCSKDNVLAVAFHPELTDAEVEAVVGAVRAFFA